MCERNLPTFIRISAHRQKQDKCFPWLYVEIIVLSTERQTVQLDAGLSPAGKQHSNDPIRRRADWLIWLVTSELPYLWVMPLNAKGALQLTHSNWFREHWEPAPFAKGNINLVEVLDGRELAFIQPTCSTLLASLWDNNCWHLTKTTMWLPGLHSEHKGQKLELGTHKLGVNSTNCEGYLLNVDGSYAIKAFVLPLRLQ